MIFQSYNWEKKIPSTYVLLDEGVEFPRFLDCIFEIELNFN